MADEKKKGYDVTDGGSTIQRNLLRFDNEGNAKAIFQAVVHFDPHGDLKAITIHDAVNNGTIIVAGETALNFGSFVKNLIELTHPIELAKK